MVEGKIEEEYGSQRAVSVDQMEFELKGDTESVEKPSELLREYVHKPLVEGMEPVEHLDHRQHTYFGDTREEERERLVDMKVVHSLVYSLLVVHRLLGVEEKKFRRLVVGQHSRQFWCVRTFLSKQLLMQMIRIHLKRISDEEKNFKYLVG
jgi:hypothetical protein